MKMVALVARILLGLMFFVFGLNHIFGNFLHLPAPPGDAGDYERIFGTYPFFKVIGMFQVVAGLLILVGRFVPLALAILAPIIVNILMFDLFLAPSPAALAPGVLAAVLELILIAVYRKSFYTLFYPAPEVF